MSGPLVSASAAFVAKNSRIPPYAIEQSLRFDGTNTLTKTFTGTARTTLTVSGWVKFGKNHNYGSNLVFYGTGGGGQTQAGLGYGANNGFYVPQLDQTGGSYENATHLDFSAWLHVVYSRNGTSSHTLYINGVESPMTNGGTGSLPNSWLTGPGVINNPNGYVAELHVVDGSNLNQYDFGEFDDNGVWRPIEYTGSHGTNGYYLKFDPSATNGIGHDHSGNGNHWTPAAGFVTSGTGTDVMNDTPTTNWCTLNPLDNGGATLSNANLEWDSGGQQGTRGTIFVSSGKWYWEITSNESNLIGEHGVASSSQPLTGLTAYPSYISTSWGFSNSTGNAGNNNVGTNIASAGSQNDVIMVAVDMDNSKIWWGRNGTWFNSGNPATGANAVFTNLSGSVAPMTGVGGAAAGAVIYNFGQRDFAYTPPTGFKALNTRNLNAPDIADGSEYFNTVLYSGNSSTQTISGVGFQPDLIFVKARSTAQGPSWYNAISGFNKILMSTTSTNGDTTDTGGLNGVTSDGFTLDGNNAAIGGTNGSGQTYVAWNWLAANGTSSNTDGSITSTVSANPSAGFSIVSYTGNGTAGATVGHGLGIIPAMIIIKNRDASYNWYVGHKGAGLTGDSLGSYSELFTLLLNSTQAKTNYGGAVAALGDSSVFAVGDGQEVNTNNERYIAYCFAEVEGYSKFGSYTGNGNADGPFVYTGFRVGWLLVKRSDSIANWFVYDNKRLGYNQDNRYLRPDVNDAEGSGDNYPDMLSNGFKPRVGSQSINVSGATYIYMALAENPFGGSGVSPATAR